MTDFEVELDWQPFEVDPQTPVEGLPPVRSWYEEFTSVAHAFGLTNYRVPSWVPNMRHVLSLMEYARSKNKLDAFREHALINYWEQEWNLDGDEALAELARLAGLPVKAALKASTSKQWWAKVQSARKRAVKKGVHAVPALDFGQGGLVVGAQRYEVYLSAAAQTLANRSPALVRRRGLTRAPDTL